MQERLSTETRAVKTIDADKSMAELFLNYLHSDFPDPPFAWQVYDDTPAKDESKRKTVVDTFEKQFGFLQYRNQDACSVCVTINDIGNNKRRRHEDVVRVRKHFVEIDGPATFGAIWKRCEEIGLLPSWINESSPGHYHVYWDVADDVAGDLSGFKPRQKRLVEKFKDLGAGDESTDLSRVLRLPGFWHMKNPTEPFQVRIVYRPLDEAPVYSLADFERALGKVPPQAHAEHTYLVEPIPFDIFKQMLDKTPHTGGPEGLTDRHSYQDCVNFLMALHEAAAGNSGEYLEAAIDWCLRDPRPDWKTPTSREWVESKWNSFNNTTGNVRTRASWFKLLKHLGHGDLVNSATLAAFADCFEDADEIPATPASGVPSGTPELSVEDDWKKEIEDAAREDRPKIKIATGKEPQAKRQIKKILIDDGKRDDCPSSDMLFRRGEGPNSLVHLSRNKLEEKDYQRNDGKPPHDANGHGANELLVSVAETNWFTDRVERAAKFYKLKLVEETKDGQPTGKKVYVPYIVAAPQKIINGVPSVITKHDFPKLTGTTETPTMRADYSLLDKPGYDHVSGLYYDVSLVSHLSHSEYARPLGANMSHRAGLAHTHSRAAGPVLVRLH